MSGKWQFQPIGPCRYPPQSAAEEVAHAYALAVWHMNWFTGLNPCEPAYMRALAAGDGRAAALWSRLDRAVFSMRIAIEEEDAGRLEAVADRLAAERAADVARGGRE
jgi:hypothetical protein